MYMKRHYVNNDRDISCERDDNNKTQTLSVYKLNVDMPTIADCLQKLDNTYSLMMETKLTQKNSKKKKYTTPIRSLY